MRKFKSLAEMENSLDADKIAIVNALREKKPIRQKDFKKMDAVMIQLCLADLVKGMPTAEAEALKAEWKEITGSLVDIAAFFRDKMGETEKAKAHEGERKKLPLFTQREWFKKKYCEIKGVDPQEFTIPEEAKIPQKDFVDIWE